jgi:hypothetical protein
MTARGVPAALAAQLATASGADLATLIGNQLTEKFW